MAQIIGVDQDLLQCSNIDGGIVVSYALDFVDLLTVTFGANDEVTAITIDPAVNFAKFTYDDDDSAFYNQTGEREGKKHTFTQEAFLKFTAPFEAVKTKSLNDLKDICNLVWVHYLTTGDAWFQGFEKFGSTFRKSKQSAKATVSHISGTGAETSRTEVSINSVARETHLTTLTTADIEAL
jgi:hypothetical protein